ncbi:endonuclease [Halorhodospira abdelmalekii]|uniref:endonuclease III domain-containing protein n=1 Tax=Halorhodospira abdelmalekii TaxID=421629 RepID=UPI001907E5FE|nr:endonuclease [Halorhodospira abdelmalekii]MBK1734587.1 endonuclease [Halorhodospira abdelmalekii]
MVLAAIRYSKPSIATVSLDGGELLELDRERLEALLEQLVAYHGQLHWWPAQSTFEILMGAVLTQNTAWRNVEHAIAQLRATMPLTPHAIVDAPSEQLAAAIRPSGYYNVKAQRLRTLSVAYLEAGGYDGLDRLATNELRDRLLAVKGVGRETADDILLYAFKRPVFVIDAYTRRIFSRLGWCRGDEPYEVLRAAVEEACGAERALFHELHAQLVELGKATCRPRPRCNLCPLASSAAETGRRAVARKASCPFPTQHSS